MIRRPTKGAAKSPSLSALPPAVLSAQEFGTETFATLHPSRVRPLEKKRPGKFSGSPLCSFICVGSELRAVNDLRSVDWPRLLNCDRNGHLGALAENTQVHRFLIALVAQVRAKVVQ